MEIISNRAVRASLSRSSHDDWDVKSLSNRGVCEHVVTIEGRVPVASNAVQADLHINDQKKSVILVQSLEGNGYSTSFTLAIPPPLHER